MNRIAVIDTGPLAHLARCDQLEVLQTVLNEHVFIIPDTVVSELRNGLNSYPKTQSVLDASWIEQRSVDTPESLSAFATFARFMVGKNMRNYGECAVLALAQTLPRAIAVLDDWVAVKTGRRYGVEVRPTLSLFIEAINSGACSSDTINDVVDRMLETGYRYPFLKGEFVPWARDKRLI